MLEEYLKKLKEKYNYDDNLMEAIGKIIPALVKYYGEYYQTTILDALYSCKIHFQQDNENMQEYLQKYFETDEEFEFSILTGAFYECRPVIKNSNVKIKYIIYIPKIYDYSLDLSNSEDLAILVHEICHLVKGFNRVTVNNDKIIIKTGLSQDIYDFNGFVRDTKNVGIDEVLNCYEEEEIMSLILGYPYKTVSYKGVSKIIYPFMRNEEIRNSVRKAEFTDSDDWVSLLGKENVENLSKDFDNIIEFCNFSLNDLSFDYSEEFIARTDAGESREQINKELSARVLEERNRALDLYDEAYKNIETFITNYNNTKKLK